MRYFNPGSVLIGFVIPFVAVVGGVAVLGRSQNDSSHAPIATSDRPTTRRAAGGAT